MSWLALGLCLVLASPSWAVDALPVTARPVTAAPVTARAVHIGGVDAAPQAVPDVTSSMVAVWNCEEVSGNLSDASGNGNGLTQSGTVGRGTTDPPQGSRYCIFDGVDDEATCADGTCPSLRLLATNYTVTGWFRVTRDTDDTMIDKHDVVSGYELQFEPVFDGAWYYHGDGTTLSDVLHTGNFPVSTWSFHADIFDAARFPLDSIRCRRNSTTTCPSTASPENGLASAAVAFTLGNGSLGFGQFDADQVIIDNAAWSDAFWCRICSCNLDGALCMGTTTGGYRTCSSDTECRVLGNTTALCNSGQCVGRNSGETLNCSSCEMAASDVGAP